MKRICTLLLLTVIALASLPTLSLAQTEEALTLVITDKAGFPLHKAVVDVYVRAKDGLHLIEQTETNIDGIAYIVRPNLANFDFRDDIADITLKVYYPEKIVESLYWSLPVIADNVPVGLESHCHQIVVMKDSGNTDPPGQTPTNNAELQGSGVFRSTILTTYKTSQPVTVGEMHFIPGKTRATFKYMEKSSTTIELGKSTPEGGGWSGNGFLTRTTTSSASLPSDYIEGGSCEVKATFSFDYEYWAYQEQDVDNANVWHNIYTWEEFVPSHFIGFMTPGESVNDKDNMPLHEVQAGLYGHHGELFPGGTSAPKALKKSRGYTAAYTFGSGWSGSATANYHSKASVELECLDTSHEYVYWAYDYDTNETMWYVTSAPKPNA